MLRYVSYSHQCTFACCRWARIATKVPVRYACSTESNKGEGNPNHLSIFSTLNNTFTKYPRDSFASIFLTEMASIGATYSVFSVLNLQFSFEVHY